MRPVLSAVLCLLPGPALAHGGHGAAASPLDPGAWTFDPLVLGSLLAAGLLYGGGTARLWRRAGAGRGVAGWRASCFAAGMLVLVVALVSPLDAWSDILFSAHMAQHVLLVTAAPLLLVAARPAVPVLFALPRSCRRSLGAWGREAGLLAAGRRLATPAVASLLQAAALWVWHAPAAFEAALADEAVHTAEHLSLLATALLFWWGMAHSVRRGPAGFAVAGLWMLVTVVQGGLLGALITFAPHPLYASYAASATHWGVSPLTDQQLAGVIMWVVLGTVHLLAALAIVGIGLHHLEVRSSGRMADRAAADRR